MVLFVVGGVGGIVVVVFGGGVARVVGTVAGVVRLVVIIVRGVDVGGRYVGPVVLA